MVDESLLRDLLLVTKINQESKMKIQGGKRIDEGQLDAYYAILEQLEEWKKEAEELENGRHERLNVLITGKDRVWKTSCGRWRLMG